MGDNVGDCAGMAADLFESYAVTLVAALILGQVAFGAKGLMLPLMIGGIGMISSVVGILTTRLRTQRPHRPGADQPRLHHLGRGVADPGRDHRLHLPADALQQLKGGIRIAQTRQSALIAFLAVLIGIVLAVLIQQLTGYFTDTIRRPVQDVAKTSLTGPATVILSGISLGLESAVYTAVLIAWLCSGPSCSAAGRSGSRCSRSRWPAAACSPRPA